MERDTSMDPTGKVTLFNKTRISQFTRQEDIQVVGDEEKEILWIVGDHY
jgi:hypothetical protein